MRRTIRGLVMLALVAPAWAPAVASAQAVTTTQDRALARLQAKLASDPTSVKTMRAVGVKLFELQRYAEARTVLDQVRQLDPKDGVSALYSGLASEELQDYAAAKVAYTRYLEVGKTRRVRNSIRERLVVVAKEELKQAAKVAVANEQALQGQQVPGTTVAVLPFRCNCADTTLLPLERGMADLVVSDLARASALRVLERDRMQAIVDEINLARTGAVDPATAARTGKLIAAGRILNGQIIAQAANQLDLAGAVVNTNTAAVAATPSASGSLNAIFDAERNFVLDVFNDMGVTLTAEERRAFETRRVPSLQAFLAYSRGLIAEDEGRLDDAVALFESARSLDPGFSQALQRAQNAAAARSGAQVSSQTVQNGLRNSSEGQVVAAAQRGSTSDVTVNLTLNNVVGDVNPTITNTVQNSTAGGNTGQSNTPQANPAAEKTGTDQPAVRIGQLTIVIRKP